VSKWCPWELGYFSGKKKFRCASLPLNDAAESDFPNQEYLQIYPYVDFKKSNQSQDYEVWINDPETKKSITLHKWINGLKLQ